MTVTAKQIAEKRIQELADALCREQRSACLEAHEGVHDLKKLRVTYLGRRWWTRKHKIRITFEFEDAEHSFVVALHKRDTFQLHCGSEHGMVWDDVPKNIG